LNGIEWDRVGPRIGTGAGEASEAACASDPVLCLDWMVLIGEERRGQGRGGRDRGGGGGGGGGLDRIKSALEVARKDGR